MFRFTIALGLAIALAGLLSAQPKTPMAELSAANLPGQRIGPHDLIAISVYDSPELTRTIRVGGDGLIRLPMLRARLTVAGLLPSEVETLVAEALRKEGVLVDPVVSVTVAEYHSRPISVGGAVRKPITFQAAGRVTLLEALGRAEGLSADAGPEILVTRADPDQPSRLRTDRLSVRDLFDHARSELNFTLLGGEEIRVPEAKKIYVTGNVKRPGAFPVRDGAGMTVMKALALAEGVSPFSTRQVYIYRLDAASGAKREIPVELARILKRQAEDVALEPEDMLYIPENTGRKTISAVAEKASGFGLATMSGVLIWRR